MEDEPEEDRPKLIRTYEDASGYTVKVYEARYACGAIREDGRPRLRLITPATE